MRMILLAHPGTQYSHRLAVQLSRHNSLYEFWTGFALAKHAWYTRIIQSCISTKWNRKIANRIIEGVPAKRLRTLPTTEWKALSQLRRGGSSQEIFHKRNKVFQELIPESAIQSAAAIIGFDTSSWILATRAQKLGKPFFLDQSIAHPVVKDSILQKVAQRFPDWREELEERLPVVLNCENQEYKLATKIVAASSYTKQTLVSQGVSPDKILINPYGVDLDKFHPPTIPREHSHRLRFLFLGAISARKGVPLLIEAWRKLALENAELWLVGPVSERERDLIPTLPGLQLKGKYPFDELPELLRECDVLVFPSYCEGFALVLLEALASGMPVITTEATAGPDLIENGREGLLITSGDVEDLCRSMEFLVKHPEEIKNMSVAARHCAEKFSWDSYGERWQHVLEEFASC